MEKGTCRKEIHVGEKIPNEVIIWCEKGSSIAMNLGSWYFDSLFQRELKKIQEEKYEFSEICRNENEQKAFYAAIAVNLLKNHNVVVEFIDLNKNINTHEIKYDENWALDQAVLIANQSNCKSKRGVVIWHYKYGLISSGFNAPPTPLVCDGSEECRLNCSKTAVHAEQVALIRAISAMEFRHLFELKPGILLPDCEMLHVKTVDGKPVFSEKPSCWQCSKLILEAGILSMWLYQKDGLTKYTPLEFHKQTLINCDLDSSKNKEIWG